MSYIGNSPITAAFLTDTFSGNGSTTAFTMSIAPAGPTSCIVAISGVVQDPSTYSTSGTTLTFSAAPPPGTNNISVRYLGIPASGVTTTTYRTVTEFTATAGQTSFSTPSYTVGFINVYRNGVLLGSADYIATTGTTVVLATGATAGDLVVVESFYVSSVLNAIPAVANAVITSYINNGAVDLTSKVTGTLPVANGGTGLTSGFKNGITEADQWRLTSSALISASTYITANLERTDTDGFGKIGTGMSQTSGEFSFPSTGVWLIDVFFPGETSGAARTYAYGEIYTTLDNSTYNSAASSYNNGYTAGANFTGSMKFLFNVTNTSLCKVKFLFNGGGGNTYFYGDTNTNTTTFTFIRLGDSV